MRGLYERCMLANLRVLASIYGEFHDTVLDFQGEVTYEALCLGYRDARDGNDMPSFFRNEPMLRDSWCRGVEEYSDQREMDQCMRCNSDDGAPCPSHG